MPQDLVSSFVEHNYLPEQPYYAQALGKAIELLTKLTHLSLTIAHTDLVYPDFHYIWQDPLLHGIGEDDPEEDVDGIAGCIANIPSLRWDTFYNPSDTEADELLEFLPFVKPQSSCS